MTPDDAPAELARYSATADRLRRELARLSKLYGPTSTAFARHAKRLAEQYAPQLAGDLTTAQLVAWFQAGRAAAAPLRLPALPPANVPSLPPGFGSGDGGSPSTPRIVLPAVARASLWVRSRIPFTAAEYAQLDADAKAVAFTVARVQSLDAVERVQQAVATDVETGGTLRQFRQATAAALAGSGLGPAAVEALYRTHVGRAYGAGQRAVLDAPAVRSGFPYVLYSATHDGRTRVEHLMMEKLGLDGTAVYRADDPVWDLFWPPWAWNCRCQTFPLSVRAAAGYGVREAEQWLRDGKPPADPQFVKPMPFLPPKGWVPTGRRLAAVIGG